MRGYIKKRSKKSYSVVVYLGRDPATGKPIQKWHTVQGTRRDAEAKMAKLLVSIDEGTYALPGKTTIRQLFDDWLKEHAERNCSRKTAERYQQLVEIYVLPRIGEARLKHVSTLVLERFYNELREKGGKKGRPLSAKTVRHVAGIVHSALGAAVRWRILPMNPATGCQLPKLEKREAAVLGDAELEWLIDAAGNEVYWVRPFLVAAIATGARRGELLAASWSDVDMDVVPAVLNISKSLEQTRAGLRAKPPKNGKPRRLPLPSLAVEALQVHRGEQEEFRKAFGKDYRTDLDLVFATPEGEYLKPDSVTAKISLLAKKCGFKGVSLHTLRHTHGSQLLSDGVPLPTVSKRLGHSSVNVTASIYAHAFDRDELAAAEVWDTRMRKSLQREEARQ